MAGKARMQLIRQRISCSMTSITMSVTTAKEDMEYVQARIVNRPVSELNPATFLVATEIQQLRFILHQSMPTWNVKRLTWTNSMRCWAWMTIGSTINSKKWWTRSRIKQALAAVFANRPKQEIITRTVEIWRMLHLKTNWMGAIANKSRSNSQKDTSWSRVKVLLYKKNQTDSICETDISRIDEEFWTDQ